MTHKWNQTYYGVRVQLYMEYDTSEALSLEMIKYVKRIFDTLIFIVEESITH